MRNLNEGYSDENNSIFHDQLSVNESMEVKNQVQFYIDKQLVIESKVDVDFLICSICHNLLWNPVMCGMSNGCHNSFCKGCIEEWLQKCKLKGLRSDNYNNEENLDENKSPNLSCPNCKLDFIPSHIPPLLIRLLKSIILRCEYHQNGCKEQLTYEQFFQHISRKCQYRIKLCRGCQQKIIAKNYLQHTFNCDKYLITCQECNEIMPKKKFFNEHRIIMKKNTNQKSIKDNQNKEKINLKYRRSYQCYENQIQNYDSTIKKIQCETNNIENKLQRFEKMFQTHLISNKPLNLSINFYTRFMNNFSFPVPTLIKSSYNLNKKKYDFLHFYIDTPIYLNSFISIQWKIQILKMKGNILLGFCSSLGLQSLDFILNKFGEVKVKNYNEKIYKLINLNKNIEKEQKQSLNFTFSENDVLKLQYKPLLNCIEIIDQTKNSKIILGNEVIQQFKRTKNHLHQRQANKIYAFYSMDTLNDSFKFIY